jgi:hypothetical protein
LSTLRREFDGEIIPCWKFLKQEKSGGWVFGTNSATG